MFDCFCPFQIDTASNGSYLKEIHKRLKTKCNGTREYQRQRTLIVSEICCAAMMKSAECC